MVDLAGLLLNPPGLWVARSTDTQGVTPTILPTFSATVSMQLYRMQGFGKTHGLTVENICTSPNMNNRISGGRLMGRS